MAARRERFSLHREETVYDRRLKPLRSARRVAGATLACAATGSLVGAAGSASRSDPPVAAVAQELARDGATRVIVLESDRGHVFVATAGASRPRPTQRFRIGSITKTFTASLVMQLVDQHRLRLNDTIARYLPGVVPDGANITIRDLLRHESGLADFTDYGSWLAKADSSWVAGSLVLQGDPLHEQPIVARSGLGITPSG